MPPNSLSPPSLSPWMGQCVARGNMRWFIAFNVAWMCFLAELLYLVFAA